MYCIYCGVEGVVDEICDECSMEQTGEQLITCYFHRGYPYEAIAKLLKKKGFNVSVRTLKRPLSTLGLRRRGNDVRIGRNQVRAAVLKEMEGAGGLSGYRSIWHALRLRHKIHVPLREVAELMKEIDPFGVEERRARKLRRRTFTSAGSNASWHMDGYDKLKPYGFPIYGGIDGFSRKILWLEVARSNNDPRVAATFYLNQVKEVSQEKIDEMEQHCHIDDPDENLYHEYFIYVMETEGLSYPISERDSLVLYQRLVHLQRD